MKLFGKNNNGDEEIPENEAAEDTGFTEDAGFDETSEPLAAPSRPDVKSGGSRKAILLILPVLAAVGGGYYYMTSTQAPPAPEMQQQAALPEETPLVEAPPVVMAEAPAVPSVPPMVDDPLALPPPEDILTQEPPMPGDESVPLDAAAVSPPVPEAMVADPLAVPAPDTVLSDVAAMPETTAPSVPEATPAAEAATAVPVPDAGVVEAAVPEIAAAPVADAAAASSDIAAVGEISPEVKDPLAVPETMPAATDTAATAPLAPDAAEDLPLPPSEEEIAMPLGAVPPVTPTPEDVPPMGQTSVTPTVTPATDSATTAAQPSEGEMAIVNNAGTLDKMTPPAAKAVEQALSAEPAMVRPLPQRYLIVQNDHKAGEIDTRLTAARLALGQGRGQAALQIFNELRADYPRDKRVLMGRAVSLQKLGQSGEALDAYEEVLTHDPKNLDALTNMLGLLKKENPSLAVEKLVELREAYPYNADITAQLGIAYAGAGEYEEGLKYLNMADALKPGSAFVLYNRGVLFDKTGRTTEAADIYRQIIRMYADGYLDQNLPIDTIKRRLAVMR